MPWSDFPNYKLVSKRKNRTRTFFNYSVTQKAWLVERVTETVYEANGLTESAANSASENGDNYESTYDESGGSTTTVTSVEAIRSNPAGGFTARKTVTQTIVTVEIISSDS